jgi:hypothetical protein
MAMAVLPSAGPVRNPAPAWLRLGLVAGVVVASVGGWSITTWAEQTRAEATRVAAVATATDREAELATARADRIEDQRDGLAALVVYRCDVGVITDAQLCRAAREWR